MKYPKRLIEVDLPIARISAHARREKSIRHGHISTLHIWWARRPLAACRAVICAALWPDPADPLCPLAFREQAIQELTAFAKRVNPERLTQEKQQLHESLSEVARERWESLASGAWTPDPTNEAGLTTLREALLDFIADFANWDNSKAPAYLDTSRELTKAAHEALGGASGTRPLVVDPFAGGGSIPLEALRVGADVFASDLNPVPVLLNKVVLEYIPKYGKRLADEVHRWGKWIEERAEKELADYYPKGTNGETPIAYLWVRTIKCEGPLCGAEVPLMRSLWLAKKGDDSVALRISADTKSKRVAFEIIKNAKARDVEVGTIRRGAATCPCCGYTTPVTSMRSQLRPRRGGADDARLVAVRYDDAHTGERSWRLSNQVDVDAVARAVERLKTIKKQSTNGLPVVPDEPLPPIGTLGFRVQNYGMLCWGDLFSSRQSLSLATLGHLARTAPVDSPPDLAVAIRTCLALAVDRLADFNASLCVLNSVGGRGVVHVFGRQALPMVWDFMETNPFNTEAANWRTCYEVVDEVINNEGANRHCGTVSRANAAQHPLPDDSAAAFVTDPPYYDAVPYADLSDFFYVWLRRNLPVEHESLVAPTLTEKEQECIVDPVRKKDREFFERNMWSAMSEGRRVLQPNGIGIVVFAHKSTAGWETQLQAMVDAGWIVTGSWPIDTERPGRLRAQGSAALASSVHLICRPRENTSGAVTEVVGEWRDVLGELPKRIHEWMPRLAAEGVVGADAIFACLGPALEIFSRFSRVEKSNGEPATLREFLEHVWAAVATEALSLIFKDANAAGLEPDARLTAMWLWTLGGASGNDKGSKGSTSDDGDTEATDERDDEESLSSSSKGKALGGFPLEYDAARKIAQGLGVHLEQCESLVEIKGDKARLLPVAERTVFLFGKGTQNINSSPSRRKKPKQKTLFGDLDEAEAAEAGWTDLKGPPPGTTILDRVHQSMILFAANRGELLKRFLVEEGVGKDERFWKLADNLNKLYPPGTDERRWIEGVLARKKGLGF